MKRHVAVLSAVAIAAAALTGCTGKADESTPGDAKTSQSKAGQPTTMTIEISYDDLLKQQQISRSVRLSVGDFLQVSLGSNASTGFQWADKMLLSDPKVMTQTGHVRPGGVDAAGHGPGHHHGVHHLRSALAGRREGILGVLRQCRGGLTPPRVTRVTLVTECVG